MKIASIAHRISMALLVLFIWSCKTPIEFYPDYTTPTEKEASVLQQSRLKQYMSHESRFEDKPGLPAETQAKEYLKGITYLSPNEYEYDEKGIARVNRLVYKRGQDKVFLSYPDTLFLNQNGYVVRTTYNQSQFKQGGSQYQYNSEGYLIKEYIPEMYLSHQLEANYYITCRHEYADGNRVRSTFFKRYNGDQGKVMDSVVVTFDYNAKLINSGLPYTDFDVLHTTLGYDIVSRLGKYHPSLYGKLNKNLPVRATIRYLKDNFNPYFSERNYTFEYEFNTKKQVTSMFVARRTENVVYGLLDTYEYVE